MNRSKGRMLAVMLAATTVLSSVLPGAVMAAEPVDADTSVNAVAETAAETEPGDVQESAVTDEAPAEGSGADEAETLEGQREEEAVEGPATGSSEADPSEEPGNAGTDDTTAQEAEPENEPDKETADKDEEKPIGRFAIRFDSEGGVVKVIMSSDEGANEDDPSYTLEKKDSDGVTVTERNGRSYSASETEEGFILDIEEDDGEEVTVIADAAEGFHVSGYSVTADAGGEEDTGFNGGGDKYSHTISVRGNDRKVIDVGFEKDEARTEKGRVAVKVGSAGGTVTVMSGETTYTITKADDGTVSVTDQDGNMVDAGGEFDLVVEDEIGKNVSVRAAADEGAKVTAFAVTDEEPAFKAEVKPTEHMQDVEIAEGLKVVSVSFISMPEFTAEQAVGRYVVRLHAAAGILPAGTVAEVRELTEEEAEPFVKEAEKASGGEVVASFDITFKDAEGREIQPAGMVEVSFDNGAEDDSTMSVVHAVDGSVQKMETVPSSTEGDSVQFQSDSFSPFFLTASTDEPDWTKGGGGIVNVSDKVSVKHDNEYRYWYEDYGFFNGEDEYPHSTFCLGMYVDGGLAGWSVCVDPVFDGRDMEGVWAGEVWQVSAPMFVKAMYYGPDGPRSDVIKSATGYSDYGAINIIAHVAASEIYARLGYSQSGTGDGFLAANGTLRNAVYKYVNAIADLPTPSGYYGYVTEKNGRSSAGYRHQNFAFGSFTLTKGSAQVKKVSSAPEMTNGNSCYSLEGARYWIYTSEAAAKARGDAGWVSGGTLITDANGVSGTFQLDPGTYYMIEGEAPRGFIRSDEAIPFTITRGNTTVVTATDVAADDPANFYISKKCKDAAVGKKINSLKDTEFTVNYYNGYYDASSLPSNATKTWVIKVLKTDAGLFRASLDDEHFVSGDSFYMDGNIITLPLGTITVKETKAAEGYFNDGTFGGAAMYIGQIQADPSAPRGAKIVDIQGTRSTSNNSFEVTDTPKPPSIVRTTATDTLTDSHSAYPGSEVTIKDEVVFENLIVGSTYTLKGELLDRNTGRVIKDANGNPVTAEKKFVPESVDGSVTIYFTFPADRSFRGKTTVAGETLIPEEGDPIVHTDITDEAQTVRFPRIGTTAVGAETEDHVVRAGEDAKIIDTVSYENLVAGQKYSLKGVVMVKSTGKPLVVDGEEVRAEKTFTTAVNDAAEELVFTFDSTDFAGEELVVFEELLVGETLVADHKDLKDLGQTVTVPYVETDAADKDTGKKNTLAAEDRVIIDKVSYKGLIAGRTYVITGDVKIKADDTDTFDDAETVPSVIIGAAGKGQITFDDDKVTFVPAGTRGEPVSGEVIVSFRIDASDLAGEELVVGETVTYNGKEVAVHRDINDTRQNDLIPKGSTTAIDTETGIKNTLAAENRVFKDTFAYEKLLPGETYRFTGKVMVKTGTDEDGTDILEETPSFMTDENGDPVANGYVEFTPEEPDGTLDLYFSIDASELADKDITVFEKVTLGGEPVIVHEVLDGSQTVYVPEGETTAVDSETRDQISFPDEEVSVIDTFVYKNLIPGTEYTVRGRVMRKDTGEEIPSSLTEAGFSAAGEGEEPTGSISLADDVVTFTPDQKDGALSLTFMLDGTELEGEDTVVFERAYHNGREVIIHENIDDEPQTVHIPAGHTLAEDPDTDDRTMMAKGDVLIRDRVIYENILPGYEYVLTGRVMLKPIDGGEATELDARMVDPDGNEVEEWVFTPEEKDGTEDVYFIVNADDLAGRSVVMYEDMKFINPELETRTTIFRHEDIDDEEQTVHFPDGGTTALDSDTGSHTSNADEDVTILDELKYINLIPGKVYNVTGTLMDKETGRPVIVNGAEVTASRDFVPDSADGSVIVEFKFDGSALAGRSVVAFETVTSNGKEVFVHADLEDEDQTVEFPEVHTSAVDKKDGDRQISHKGTVQIVDKVTYKNLTPGTRYHVSGVLMDKNTRQPAKSGGREIVGETTFTASEKDGEVSVTFSFNSSDLKDGEYVVFEELYEVNAETGDENVVGTHMDINDAAQTVKRHTPPGNPKTGDDNDMLIWLAAFGAAAAGVTAAVIIRKRKTGK